MTHVSVMDQPGTVWAERTVTVGGRVAIIELQGTAARAVGLAPGALGPGGER